ncbi:MAG TPA: hypothetical protein VGO52_23515 [Hyphomonadaceae bacterium]|jgi:hypothetical protein|nr:hypothetical protein [Hyphomonadaceae bacterium]
MSEAELMMLAQGAFEQVGQLFAQVITVNFAMAAAIFYFLNEAKLPMKVFAFVIYVGGMVMYVGFIHVETAVWDSVIVALQAIGPDNLSAPGKAMLGMDNSWLLVATALFLNFGYLGLAGGCAYLLFFWKRPPHLPAHPAHGPSASR